MREFTQSLRHILEALEELDAVLPDGFLRPTRFSIGAYMVNAEWGRNDAKQPMNESVWLVARSDGVVMNANFREGWPDCGASEFDAAVAKDWLLDLTQNWEWHSENREDGRTTESVTRSPRTASAR